MGQRTLNVRTRPARVAVLVARDAVRDDLLLALRFLSVLWGGRFGTLLAVEPEAEDPLGRFRLEQCRPDFVYGIGVNHDVWAPRVREACRPRGYGPLTPAYVDRIHESVELHITAAHVVRHLRLTPGGSTRTLQFLGRDPASPMAPFLAALIGIHPERLPPEVLHEGGWFPDTGGSADLVAAHTGIVSANRRCWLDLASHGLSVHLHGTFPVPPTVVLVGSLAADLAMFWNLRSAADPDFPVWAIPLPGDAANDPAVLAALRQWLLAFEPYRRRPNFCRVTSASVPAAVVADFAARLQTEFAGTHVRYVDAWVPAHRLTMTIPVAFTEQLTVEKAGRVLRFRPTVPEVAAGVSRSAWVVDLLGDVTTRRAVGDLCLPARPAAVAVLNTPDPRQALMTGVPRLGVGVDGINLHCTADRDAVGVYLPTGTEVLEEVLREAGVLPKPDEKRACYLPVVRMFGGLREAAEAFSGQRGAVLRALASGPLSVGELQGKARLGGGKLKELAHPQWPRQMLDTLEPVVRRTLQRRSRDRWSRELPATTEAEALMEFWADRGVVTRQWQVGPCPACMGTYWEPRLDISRPVRCPGCDTRIRLPQQVPLGYSLHRLVAHAIRQGIAPVVLAGRFLRRMTGSGFLWLPGVKFERSGAAGDLDLVAACDGHLVVGECKTLGETPAEAGLWEKIWEQFAETVEVGRACGAELAVLAVLADRFPDWFQERADRLAGPAMPCLLLAREELERGYREAPGPAGLGPRELSLGELLVDPMPETPRVRAAEPRQIQTPIYSTTY